MDSTVFPPATILMSVADINRKGFITRVKTYDQNGEMTMYYDHTYLNDSILEESRLNNIANPEGFHSVTKYSYNRNNQVELCQIYNHDKLVTSTKYRYTKDHRLKEIYQTWNGE